MSFEFLNSALIATARTACKLTPEELQERKGSGAAGSVQLPIFGGLLVDMKEKMWTGHGWTCADMQSRMTYIGRIWGFEMGA